MQLQGKCECLCAQVGDHVASPITAAALCAHMCSCALHYGLYLDTDPDIGSKGSSHFLSAQTTQFYFVPLVIFLQLMLESILLKIVIVNVTHLYKHWLKSYKVYLFTTKPH